jgi:16S rRNA (uracil1498-N3)-methyltransferase
MHRFYATPGDIRDNIITIRGSDVNHIRNVLRMRKGDKLIICDGQGKDYYCIIDSADTECVMAIINSSAESDRELSSKITLFQGLPKADKMEQIIQKAVELGVYEIIPVMTARSVVRLDDKKKEAARLKRWQAIAESAAKQSQRGIIPGIGAVTDFKSALEKAKGMDMAIIPYENERGMKATVAVMDSLASCRTIGVFIGPEGGFEEQEISLARELGIIPVSLGRRILRTETAGICALSMMLLVLEQ